jgi:hypothetical protein
MHPLLLEEPYPPLPAVVAAAGGGVQKVQNNPMQGTPNEFLMELFLITSNSAGH